MARYNNLRGVISRPTILGPRASVARPRHGDMVVACSRHGDTMATTVSTTVVASWRTL